MHVRVATDGSICGKECSYCYDKAYLYIVANDGSARSFYYCEKGCGPYPDWYSHHRTKTCPYNKCEVCGTRPPPSPPQPRRDDNSATLGLAIAMALLGGAKYHEINNPRP